MRVRVKKKVLSRSIWEPPEDMPAWQKCLVKAGKMCGHALKNQRGRYCTRDPEPDQHLIDRPRPPWRCADHGGYVPHQLKPRRAGLPPVTGAFSKCILPGEEERFAEIMRDPMDLSYEITLTRLRLERAIKAEQDELRRLRDDDERERVERTTHTVTTGPDGVHVSNTVEKKKTDWPSIIRGIAQEIAKLTAAQNQRQAGEDLGPADKAALARRAIQDARLSLGAKPEAEARPPAPAKNPLLKKKGKTDG